MGQVTPAPDPRGDRFRALGDPTRRGILALIADDERPAGQIAAAFAMTRPGVSRHLRILREAGLVRVRARGTTRLYRADTEALADMARFFARFWDDGLARLKHAAQAEARGDG
ncbi:ArsR family transcriptional regulator [Rhodobacteraceae bacterium CCMM004]|nr:ArsR family transcriptional regulator [Rhodobacteraceae bacterium CCMM004]